ncbi:MAG: hypothetical protein KGM96_09660 [Acidobacteriota bacterium]|nr:hypothetical protein [Acidobacteriota bacterium]
MSTESQSVPASVEPAHANPAVARCSEAFARVYKANIAINQTKAAATDSAAVAFREAMPPLVGQDNIRDFIACVAQGILLGAIDSSKSTKLLYAAQVALSGARSQPRSPKATAA